LVLPRVVEGQRRIKFLSGLGHGHVGLTVSQDLGGDAQIALDRLDDAILQCQGGGFGLLGPQAGQKEKAPQRQQGRYSSSFVHGRSPWTVDSISTSLMRDSCQNFRGRVSTCRQMGEKERRDPKSGSDNRTSIDTVFSP